MSELREKNEAAVYRATALQMRYELEEGHRIFRAYRQHGICFGTANYREKDKTISCHSIQKRYMIKAVCIMQAVSFWKDLLIKVK